MHFSFSDFFGDIQNFFRGGSVLGVDIGTSALKLVEVKKSGDLFSLTNYGLLETRDYLDHPNQAIQTSSLKISSSDIGTLLAMAVKEMNPKTRVAIATLPAFASFSVTLDFPDLPESEIEKAIQFQAPQYIPISMSEVSLEWRTLGAYTDAEGKNHRRVLVLAIPNDVIKNYKEVFHRAGLRLVSLEHEAFGLTRALSGSLTPVPTFIIDIGAISTSVCVVRNGAVEMMGQTDYSGTYLTQALSRSLEISMMRAEELKRRRGLVGTGVDSELSTLLLPFLDVIIQEAKRVKDAYEVQFKEKIQKVVLAGGGANLQGIEKYISDRLDCPLGHHSFTSGITIPNTLVPFRKELDNRFASAFGVARRYFI